MLQRSLRGQAVWTTAVGCLIVKEAKSTQVSAGFVPLEGCEGKRGSRPLFWLVLDAFPSPHSIFPMRYRYRSVPSLRFCSMYGSPWWLQFNLAVMLTNSECQCDNIWYPWSSMQLGTSVRVFFLIWSFEMGWHTLHLVPAHVKGHRRRLCFAFGQLALTLSGTFTCPASEALCWWC